MNLAIFAVIVARERETDRGDDIEALAGIGRSRPLLAWPLTIGMLALAGLPGTSGFMGKLFLIEATVDGDYTWLGVVIVAGSMVSLAYYLRVIAAVWMHPGAKRGSPHQPMPAIAGGSPEADAPVKGAGRCILIFGSAILCGAATRLLRRHPLAADRLGLARGLVAGDHDLAVRGDILDVAEAKPARHPA